MDKEKELKIVDKVFNRLYEKEKLNKNELFIFWDILRCVYGETSCIPEHNRIAGEILSELEYEEETSPEEVQEE